MSKERKNCMCTAMLFDPLEAANQKRLLQPVTAAQGKPYENERRHFKGNFKLFERWVRFKQFVLLKTFRKNNVESGVQVKKRKSILGIFFW